MVRTSLHLTEWVSDSISLWSFVVKHSFCLYIQFLNKESRLTQLVILTRSKSYHCHHLCCHMWGWPVFVLEPKLQNYQKLPKWNQRDPLYQFLGFLDEHSSLLYQVLHLSAGYIYLKFHLVFVDVFETVIFQVDAESTSE